MGRSINVFGVYGEQMERKCVEMNGDARRKSQNFGNVRKLFPFSFENS
jgi:hypothetical protein